jgi:hypothetical protein
MGDGGALRFVQAIEQRCQSGRGIHPRSLSFAHPPYPFHHRPYAGRRLVWAAGNQAGMGEPHV